MRSGQGLVGVHALAAGRVRALFCVTLIGLVGLSLTTASAATRAKRSYVALGDSYTSGVGTLNFYASSGSCLRSPQAYPVLVARKQGYALSFPACSGATTATLLASQLKPLSSSTQLVTIQIGGNDAGFGKVIAACLAGTATECGAAIKAADTYIAVALPKRLSVTYAKVRARAKHARVLVLGYPRLFSSSDATCQSLPMLTSTLEAALNTTANELDATIAKVTKAHHFKFVDPRGAFANHEECSKSPYLTPIVSDAGASFHPNVGGEAAFARVIEAAL